MLEKRNRFFKLHLEKKLKINRQKLGRKSEVQKNPHFFKNYILKFYYYLN